MTQSRVVSVPSRSNAATTGRGESAAEGTGRSRLYTPQSVSDGPEIFDDLYLGLQAGGALRKQRRGEELTEQEQEALGRWQQMSMWRKAIAVGAFAVGTFGLGFTARRRSCSAAARARRRRAPAHLPWRAARALIPARAGADISVVRHQPVHLLALAAFTALAPIAVLVYVGEEKVYLDGWVHVRLRRDRRGDRDRRGARPDRGRRAPARRESGARRRRLLGDGRAALPPRR